jgi:uncharacterized protein YkwD
VGKIGGRPRILNLLKQSSTIGSAFGNDFVLDHSSVSPRHAIVERDKDQIRITDLGSANGTWVSGQMIKGATIICQGEEVRIGGVSLRLELNPSTAPTKAAVPTSPALHPTGEVPTSTTAAVPRRAVTVPATQTRRKSRHPAAVAMTTVFLAGAGFFGAVYFLSWDQIERAADQPTPLRPAILTASPSANVKPASTPALRAISSTGSRVENLAVPSALISSPIPDLANPKGTPPIIASAKSPLSPADDPDSAAADDADTKATAWLAPLNYYRSLAGVSTIHADPALSAADAAHAHYLEINYGDNLWAAGAEVHQEIVNQPGYSDAGARAASNANIAARESTRANLPPPAAAIEGWLKTTFHRLWELNPGLHRAGWGQACDAHRCIEVLDIGTDVDPLYASPMPLKKPIMFPPDGSSLKLRDSESEWPDPLTSCREYSYPTGLPITLQLGPFVTPAVTAYSITKREAPNAPLEACLFNADSYLNADPSQQANARSVLQSFGAIVLIPRHPLDPDHYVVSITAGVTRSWQFKIY